MPLLPAAYAAHTDVLEQSDEPPACISDVRTPLLG